MATPDHSAAPIASKSTNFHIGSRTTPAIDVATDANPGMNLATASERAPQRAKMDSVCRTQESGDSEMRQMVFSTPLPKLRPAVYQTRSAISAANTATATNAGNGAPPRGEGAGDDQRGIRRHRQSGLQQQHVDEDEREPVLVDEGEQRFHGVVPGMGQTVGAPPESNPTENRGNAAEVYGETAFGL